MSGVVGQHHERHGDAVADEPEHRSQHDVGASEGRSVPVGVEQGRDGDPAHSEVGDDRQHAENAEDQGELAEFCHAQLTGDQDRPAPADEGDDQPAGHQCGGVRCEPTAEAELLDLARPAAEGWICGGPVVTGLTGAVHGARRRRDAKSSINDVIDRIASKRPGRQSSRI